MTRREMLMERYEDALFALLMNEVAEAEGRKALEENQRLCDSGEMVIPEAVHRRCLRTIARKTAQKDVRRFGRTLSKAASKVGHHSAGGNADIYDSFCGIRGFPRKNVEFHHSDVR